MKVLFVNACCRGGDSRTLRLATCLLEELLVRCPGAQVIRHDVYDMRLQPMDAALLSVREAICNAKQWGAPMVQPAVQFQQADAVIVAAPYWDLSFPAVLKTWVENMWVRNLTFVYRNDLPVGLCSGSVCAYVTTAGSPIGSNDLGTEYIRTVMQTLGIPGFVRLSAEALDLDSSDADALMQEATAKVPQTVDTMAALLDGKAGEA